MDFNFTQKLKKDRNLSLLIMFVMFEISSYSSSIQRTTLDIKCLDYLMSTGTYCSVIKDSAPVPGHPEKHVSL